MPVRALKLPALWYPVKRRMALERAHIGREQAEADGAAAVAVVDAVNQRRQFLAPVIVGREQIGLMMSGGHQVEQHDTDAQRLGARDPLPQLLGRASRKLVSRVSWKSVSSHQPPRSDAPLISVCAPYAAHASAPGCGVGTRNSTSMMLPRAPFIDTRFASPKV